MVEGRRETRNLKSDLAQACPPVVEPATKVPVPHVHTAVGIHEAFRKCRGCESTCASKEVEARLYMITPKDSLPVPPLNTSRVYQHYSEPSLFAPGRAAGGGQVVSCAPFPRVSCTPLEFLVSFEIQFVLRSSCSQAAGERTTQSRNVIVLDESQLILYKKTIANDYTER